MSAYNADLIRDLEEQFDAEDAKPDADLSKLRYLKARHETLGFKAIEDIHISRRHIEDRMEAREAEYRPKYESGKAY